MLARFIFFFVLAILVFHLRLDISQLNPSYTAWLWQTDWALHHLAGEFFRFQSEWTLPPGKISGLMYPMGSSIGMADSIPLFSYLLRVFSPLLPENFQFMGIWYFACLLLQCFFAYKLILEFTQRPRYSCFCVFFFVLAPPLMWRTHMALFAHWTLLWALWIYFQSIHQRRLPDKQLLAVILLSAFIHPYLFVMNLAIGLTTVVVHWWCHMRKLNEWALTLKVLGRILAFSAIFLWANGYFGGTSSEASGFGFYSANLASFFHPHDLPVILPNIPRGQGQYEGYAYLGLGIILLWLYTVGRIIMDRGRLLEKTYIPLYLCLLAMWIYSLATPVTLGNMVLFHLDSFYSLLSPIPESFRASGRFIWPLYYGILIWTLKQAAPYLRGNKWFLVAGVFLLIQLIDTRRMIDYPAAPKVEYQWDEIESLETYVPDAASKPNVFIIDQSPEKMCQDFKSHFEGWVYYPLMDWAAKESRTINIGASARMEKKAMADYCKQTIMGLENGHLSQEMLFIVHKEHWKSYEVAMANAARCFSSQQLVACWREF